MKKKIEEELMNKLTKDGYFTATSTINPKRFYSIERMKEYFKENLETIDNLFLETIAEDEDEKTDLHEGQVVIVTLDLFQELQIVIRAIKLFVDEYSVDDSYVLELVTFDILDIQKS